MTGKEATDNVVLDLRGEAENAMVGVVGVVTGTGDPEGGGDTVMKIETGKDRAPSLKP